MYGLDFEEFLWAMGLSDETVTTLRTHLDNKAKIPDSVHNQVMQYFRLYVAIGGMPEVVQKYIDTKDFRAYTTDLSLLISMKDFSLKQHIVENTLSGNTKGGLYECAVADALYKKGFDLYFYKNETTRKEVDFIIQSDGKPVPIEVKSGNNKATSLQMLLKDGKGIDRAYKFIDGNIGTSEDGIITLPLYMASFI